MAQPIRLITPQANLETLVRVADVIEYSRRTAMMNGASSLPVKQIARDYLEAFEKLLHQLDLEAVERIIHRLQVARDSGAMIYVAGNGGSPSEV